MSTAVCGAPPTPCATCCNAKEQKPQNPQPGNPEAVVITLSSRAAYEECSNPGPCLDAYLKVIYETALSPERFGAGVIFFLPAGQGRLFYPSGFLISPPLDCLILYWCPDKKVRWAHIIFCRVEVLAFWSNLGLTVSCGNSNFYQHWRLSWRRHKHE